MHQSRISVRPPSALNRYRRPQFKPDSLPVGAFDAFHLSGELPMNAGAEVTADFDGPEDRQLADDIARVMHHRPLMSRLARVESVHGGGADVVAQSAPQAAPEPAASSAQAPAPPDADPRSIEEMIDDLGHVASPPPTAEWLDNARRAHRKAKVRNAVAWATTLGIALVIVGFALVLLRV
jgi:hypothetical protein